MLFTSESDEWSTPQVLVDWLDQTFRFTLDPCATKENAKCPRYYDAAADGLSKSWERERVFLNPPYSRVGRWMEKAYTEAVEHRATVIALVAARTDTRWWQDWVRTKANEIDYLAGRVTFSRPGKEANTAPFPSALVVYRPPILRCHTRPPMAKS
jgi:site-specific DNA-methyltransferase (adenine-specific)